MLNSSVCNGDYFLSLSFGAQALYLQSCFACDSYGCFTNPQTLLRATGNAQESFDELVSAGLLIPIDGEKAHYFVVRDWWEHNKLDRRKFNAPPMVEVENLCTLRGSNRFHKLDEVPEGYEETAKIIDNSGRETEGLPGLRMYAKSRADPKQSPGSPSGDQMGTVTNVTNSNGNVTNSNEPNSNVTSNEPNKTIKGNSVRAETCECPECGKDASAYSDGTQKTVDCPACGLLSVNLETGEVSDTWG